MDNSKFAPALDATEAFQRLLHRVLRERDTLARTDENAAEARALNAEYVAENAAECTRHGFDDGALDAARELVRTGESAWLATAPEAAREAWAAVQEVYATLGRTLVRP